MIIVLRLLIDDLFDYVSKFAIYYPYYKEKLLITKSTNTSSTVFLFTCNNNFYTTKLGIEKLPKIVL